MADLRLPLTDRNVGNLPLAMTGWYLARDTELPGFFIQVGMRAKTFMIQADLRKDGQRSTIRLKVAAADEMTARDARTKAKGLLAEIAAGKDPRPPKDVAPLTVKVGQIPTLRQAWERYRVSHLERKRRSPTTIKHYEDHVERLLEAWLDDPLDRFGEEASEAAVSGYRRRRSTGPCRPPQSLRPRAALA